MSVNHTIPKRRLKPFKQFFSRKLSGCAERPTIRKGITGRNAEGLRRYGYNGCGDGYNRKRVVGEGAEVAVLGAMRNRTYYR